jgi:uncharacterized protein (TIRG00374 family)
MPAEGQEIKQEVNLRKLVLPVSIGMGVSLYLIISNFNLQALSSVHFTQRLVVGLLLAALAIAVRDFAFMYKVRLSTDEGQSWLKMFQTIIMWEFGAAITPKLGEVAFTLFVLKKSGLSYGRSVAAILLNTFLDNALFVIVFALLYLKLGNDMLLVPADCADLQGHKIMQGVAGLAAHAWVGYGVFILVAAFFGIALFILPHITRKFFHRLAAIKILSRFKESFIHLGDEIEITADEYKNRNSWFWIRMIVATFINWTARYLLANAILYAFSTGPLNMLEIFARQYVLWIFMAIPSTPGSSGVAEISFIALNCQFIAAGLSATVALIWRIYSYYLYLVLGMIILPRWAANAAKN